VSVNTAFRHIQMKNLQIAKNAYLRKEQKKQEVVKPYVELADYSNQMEGI